MHSTDRQRAMMNQRAGNGESFITSGGLDVKNLADLVGN